MTIRWDRILLLILLIVVTYFLLNIDYEAYAAGWKHPNVLIPLMAYVAFLFFGFLILSRIQS